MVRVTVMLPVETADQIYKWAAAAGLKRGQFTSTALVIGARHLARQLSPEDFLTPDMIKGIVRATGGSDAEVDQAIAAGRVVVKLT